MATEAQVAANRENARKSTGPRTEAGKNVVRFNAVKHGLCAEATVLPGEDAQAFERLRADVLRELAPAGEMQAELAERAARELWRLRRARAAETGNLRLLANPYAIQAGQEEAKPEERELYAVSQALAQDFREGNFLEKLSRWEGRCARALERCIRLLRLLQKKSPSPAAAGEGRGEGQAAARSRASGSAPTPDPRPSRRSATGPFPLPQGREREANPRFPAEFGFVPPLFAGVRDAALGGASQLAMTVANLMRTPEIQWPDGLRPA